MVHPKRIDANQHEIVKTFRRLGCKVANLSMVGHGIPDLLICHPLKPGWSCLVECKDGSKPPSKQALTLDQEEFHGAWTGNLAIIRSVEEAMQLVEQLLCNQIPAQS